MACNANFVEYIVEQCVEAGDISVRKMMGDYCIYCDGVVFGLICDNSLFIKPTEAGRVLLREEVMCPPYEGAKDYFLITDVDDSDYLASLVRATLANLPVPNLKDERINTNK